jgi:hypothetical protein
MNEAAPVAAQAWQSFYVIVGSTAGALIGLQFVVLTLISEAGMLRDSGEGMSAFASPNVVHFCAALLISAIFSVPWTGLAPPGVAIAIAGVCGFVYSIAVLRRAMRQRDYQPVLEDWIWHAALPILAYAALVHAGMQLSRSPGDTLFIVGGAALLLVFIGIHNAWDTVTYVILESARAKRKKADEARAAHSSAAAHSSSAAHSTQAAPDDARPSGPSPPHKH